MDLDGSQSSLERDVEGREARLDLRSSCRWGWIVFDVAARVN